MTIILLSILKLIAAGVSFLLAIGVVIAIIFLYKFYKFTKTDYEEDDHLLSSDA